MGKQDRRRQRRSDNEHAREQMAGHRRVLDRCGPGWSRAYQELRELDIKFEEFAHDKFDCRECPLFAECLTRNHFNNNQSWRFAWYEEEYGQFNDKPNRKDSHDGSDSQPEVG